MTLVQQGEHHQQGDDSYGRRPCVENQQLAPQPCVLLPPYSANARRAQPRNRTLNSTSVKVRVRRLNKQRREPILSYLISLLDKVASRVAS